MNLRNINVGIISLIVFLGLLPILFYSFLFLFINIPDFSGGGFEDLGSAVKFTFIGSLLAGFAMFMYLKKNKQISRWFQFLITFCLGIPLTVTAAAILLHINPQKTNNPILVQNFDIRIVMSVGLLIASLLVSHLWISKVLSSKGKKK